MKDSNAIIQKMINFAIELLITYFAAEIRIGIIQNYWNLDNFYNFIFVITIIRSPSDGASISHTSPWSQPFPE